MVLQISFKLTKKEEKENMNNLRSNRLIKIFFPLILLCLNISTWAQDSTLNTAENVVKELYDQVTFEAGQSPDWDVVKSLFLDEAVIVLRTSRESTTVFSVEGFVGDFVSFIERAKVIETGFVENIIRMKPMIFGDIAHILVLYEASIPSSKRPPTKGVDSFQLINKNGRWWIVSVTNEIPTKNNPVPSELQN